MKHHLSLIGLLTLLFIGCEPSEDLNQQRLPELTTHLINFVSYDNATGGGKVTSDNGLQVTERGLCWSLLPNPTIADSLRINGEGLGDFTCELTNLISDTTYYVRAFATNAEGTAYGSEQTFRTKRQSVPTMTTGSPIAINNITIKLTGIITSDGGSPLLSRGFCWSQLPNPTILDNKKDTTVDYFNMEISNLASGVTYYVRTYATNALGTGYGETKTITTPIKDAEGNTYHAVTIGTQTWMVENLKTRKFRNGTNIPNVSNSQWLDLTIPAWADYASNATYGTTYGRLYNWYAISYRGYEVAPYGWHVPTDEEWTTLTEYLGGDSIAGGKLKEAGTTHWKDPNTGATNESGFNALPGGWYFGLSFNLGSDAVWWTATQYQNDSTEAWTRAIFYNYKKTERSSVNKKMGFSIRCIRD